MKYRKKSARTYDAVQVTDAWFDDPHPNALHPIGAIEPVERIVMVGDCFVDARVGDWIVTASHGVRYVVRASAFAATYEPVT